MCAILTTGFAGQLTATALLCLYSLYPVCMKKNGKDRKWKEGERKGREGRLSDEPSQVKSSQVALQIPANKPLFRAHR